MGDEDRPEQPPELPWAWATAAGAEQPPVLPWASATAAGPASAPAATAGAPACTPESPPKPVPRNEGPRVTAASAIAAGLPYRGDLSEDGPLRLLYLVAAASASGRLDLLTDLGRFVLHFRRGVLESASSDAAADGLGVHLVRKGAVSPESLARAEGLRDRFAGDLVSALVSFDAFRPARDLALVQEHGVLVVTKAIGADRGTSEWAPGIAATTTGFPLASRWGLVCEAARRLDPDTARQRLDDRYGRVASRTRGRVDVAELELMPQEARIASLLDGRTSVAQLAVARALDAATVVRTAFLLAATELVQFGEVLAAPPPAPVLRQAQDERVGKASAGRDGGSSTGRDGGSSTGRAAQAPPPVLRQAQDERVGVAQAAPKPVPTAPRDDRASLEAFHRSLAGKDHFEVLGAERNAMAPQLKASYFQLAKRYHPDAGVPGEPPEMKKLRADIFARIGEAWAVLGNDSARAKYLEELASTAGPPVDIGHIVQAEELFRKATVLMRSRQYAQGLAALEQAIEVNPDEPEFHMWLAWTRFLLARDRELQRSASNTAIEAALEKAPRCAYGYLFLAQMARLAGDVAAAERHLKRGLAAVPNHEELARELKFIEQKHPRK